MKQIPTRGLLFMLAVFGLIHLSNAQQLHRKASLGIMMQALNDSLVAAYELDSSEGLYIMTVAPGSTVHAIGMQEGAILKRINGNPVNAPIDVFNVITDFRAGDEIQLEYQQNGQEFNRKVKGIARPWETYDNADITYGTVSYEGNQLRSILYTPKNVSNPPIVYFMQGYTCGSIDLPFSPEQPYRRLVHDWVDAGYAVFRVEKPGVGDSESEIDCSRISFEQELRGFREGYKSLLQLDGVNLDEIFMFGHSMGGIIAPQLVDIKMPKGIITYGIGAKNWYDYMIDLYTVQPKHFGVSEEQIKEDNKINLKFNDDFLVRKLTGAELAKNESYASLFNVEELRREQYIGRGFDFWQGLVDVDVPGSWAKVKTNVLAMHGEFDIQAINDTGAKKIVEIVNSNGGSGTFLLIDKADHGFVNFNSMQENVETLGNGTMASYVRDNYNTEIVKKTISWMGKMQKS